MTSFESLLSAYNWARRGKRFRMASLQFSEYLENNLLVLRKELLLELHPRKVSIEHCSRGTDFLGYRILWTHRMLRGSTIKRFTKRTKRMLKEIQHGERAEDSLVPSLTSWMGYAGKASSRGLINSLAKRFGSPVGKIIQHVKQ